MNDNEAITQRGEISDNSLETSVINSLVERFEDRESTRYLASSQKLVNESNSILSTKQLYDIFKEKSKYYAGIKIIKTSLKHIEVYISPKLARDMLEFSQRGAVNKKNKNRKLSRIKTRKYLEAIKKW